MTKIALLIGISQYGEGFRPLPAAEKDVEAMQRILQDPEMGRFDDVKALINPQRQSMEEAIYWLFAGRRKEDLILLYFSGHGVKDDTNMLYLSTAMTRKTEKGELYKPSAIEARSVHRTMNDSRSRQQIVILDCCYSGAFAQGFEPKDGGAVDVKSELLPEDREGRVILTSSTSTQYSFEQQESDLSIYTRYIIEGIETGAADLDNNGIVSIEELHDYAKKKVQEAAPAMKPEIYAFREGFKIALAKARITDPKLRYRKEVERCMSRGEISIVSRKILERLRLQLEISSDDAAVIEVEVVKPFREYQDNLREYEQTLRKVIQAEDTLSDDANAELKRLQQMLKLRDEDVEPIRAELISQRQANNLQGTQRQLAEQYTQALSYVRSGQWLEAIAAFEQIVAQQPDYQDATSRLEDAKQQQQLAELFAEAEAAYEAKAWIRAIQALEAISTVDPQYRNVQSKLAEAKRQRKLADLYSEAVRAYHNAQWQEVMTLFERIVKIDSTYPDPQNLHTLAQQKRRQERIQREQRLAQLYNRGVNYLANRDLDRAAAIFEQIQQQAPGYRDVEAQLSQIRQELARQQSSWLPLVVVAVGWAIAGTISSLPSSSLDTNFFSINNSAGYLGGFVTGIAASLSVERTRTAGSWQRMIQIISFGAVGAFFGMLTWFLISQVSPDNRRTEDYMHWIKTTVCAAFSIGLIRFWQLNLTNRA